MVRIIVEYDKYNRSFKLLDKEIGSVLQDGVRYELVVPLVLDGTDAEEGDLLFTDGAAPLAHA